MPHALWPQRLSLAPHRAFLVTLTSCPAAILQSLISCSPAHLMPCSFAHDGLPQYPHKFTLEFECYSSPTSLLACSSAHLLPQRPLALVLELNTHFSTGRPLASTSLFPGTFFTAFLAFMLTSCPLYSWPLHLSFPSSLLICTYSRYLLAPCSLIPAIEYNFLPAFLHLLTSCQPPSTTFHGPCSFSFITLCSPAHLEPPEHLSFPALTTTLLTCSPPAPNVTQPVHAHFMWHSYALPSFLMHFLASLVTWSPPFPRPLVFAPELKFRRSQIYAQLSCSFTRLENSLSQDSHRGLWFRAKVPHPA